MEGVLRPNVLSVVGYAVSLGAVSSESALEWIHGLDLDASGLPDDAYGRFPFSADEVASFLEAVGASTEPRVAAVEMTCLLVRLPPPFTPLQVASSILDVWRHLHETIGARHGSHCACLMNCPEMPAAIRALNEATERYYEDHHDLPVPDCFGVNDTVFQASLEPIIQECAKVGWPDEGAPGRRSG